MKCFWPIGFLLDDLQLVPANSEEGVVFVYLEHIVSKLVTFSVWKVVQKVIRSCSKFSECEGSRVFTAIHMIKKKKSHSVGNISPTSSMKMLPSEAHVSFKKTVSFHFLLKCHLHLDWTCVEHLLNRNIC